MLVEQELQHPFYFGETITPDVVNYDGDYTYEKAPKGKYREQTIEVGSFPPNAFGLHDMHGNVWEWCLDTWHENYTGAPTDESAWIDRDLFLPDGSTWIVNKDNVLRGGSWNCIPHGCRSASRLYVTPDYRNLTFGFRVVCEIPRTE
jgi:formylglycine-generating enzyme required for sulfatase activity